MYKITKRDMTMEDFLKLKKFSPFKQMRFNGKTVGLATLFACQGPTLGRQMKAAGFTEDDCETAFDSFNLWQAYNQAKLNPTNKLSEKELKYVILGNKLRELFFKTYPSLLERVEREQKFAMKHGYVRTWVGPVRHLPELRLMSKNAQGNLIGIDRKLYSKMFSNLKNVASNTSIQTAEIVHAMPDVTCINMHLKKWGFRSRVFNYVHDSIDMYVLKKEKDVVYALLNEVVKIHREPYFGIGMEIELNESDLTKGESYSDGREININKFKLKKELENWNVENGTNLEFVMNIPGGFYEFNAKL